MSVIISFVVSLLKVFLPVIIEKSKDTMEDSKADPEIKRKLKSQIRAAWGGAALFVILMFIPGCFTRTIYVPDGTPVRLREPIKKAKIWVLDKDGKAVKGTMDLPEGWYALPLKDQDDSDK